MANIFAFHSIGEALRVYLATTYPQRLRDEHPCSFALLSTGQLARFEEPTETSVALTLFLYRVTVNEQLRNTFQPGRTPPELAPALPVELHWMLTVWATSAAAEHVVLAWAMSQLNRQPLLDTSMLPDAGWSPGDVIQVLPEELPLEDVMRIWEAVEPSYRISASYVARVVRLDSEQPVQQPVVERRFEMHTSVEEAP
ncbi:MAG: DUF4255 domain-containing protein [Sandaracinaceae bacterium]|nr:DUF4255 domain-containing protein [Sandaracinaceae bacterium]